MATKTPSTKTPSTSRKTTRKRVSSADAVDDQLARYRSMRDFTLTAEPAGASTKSNPSALRRPKISRGLPFVIQKHAASHLHYDFRLGWAGVLKSWAVAKGPSYDPKVRRLAVQVEDHPMEYGGFEGIIPQGQYGGGTVMVWDQGTWWPQLGHENVEAGLREGHLKFEMNGKKMKGKWALIRMHDTAGHTTHSDKAAKPNWLLIKEHDPYERAPEAEPITEKSPNSVVTGRSLEQIAQQEDHVWQSSKTAYLRDANLKPPTTQAWHRTNSRTTKNAKDPPSTDDTARPSQVSSATKTARSSRPASASSPTYTSANSPTHTSQRSSASSPTHTSQRSSANGPTYTSRVSSASSPTHTSQRSSANGATHTSLGRRPRKGARKNDRGLKARHINPPQAPASGPIMPTKTRAWIKSLPKESQPDFISPQLALETTEPPSTDAWLHELKLDGYRIQARKSGSDIQLLTRKGLDWTHRMPSIAAAVAHLPVHACTLDGEVVVLGPDGNSSFANLQASFQNNEAHPLTYFAFDLLHLGLAKDDGHNTRNLPLRDRKQLLAQILDGTGESPGTPAPVSRTRATPASDLRLSEDITGEGTTIFQHACTLHAEGIISKRADAPYRSSRNAGWLKSKCLHEQEFVIAGYTLSTEGADRIGSLLLGYYEQRTKPGAPGPDSRTRDHENSIAAPQPLIYAGRTGTGFTQKLKRDLLTRLSKLHTPKPAFAKISTTERRGALWIKPTLVAQVRFATWTADNLVRQAAFLGLREDKSAIEVVREEPTVAPRPKSISKPRAATGHASHRSQTELKVAKMNLKPTSNDTKIRLTHPEKVLDPESGLTKQQLAGYYAAVADRMLPHIADRPLSLVRCPEGAGKPCFFQKHVNSMLPSGIGSIDVPDKKTGVPEPYITLNTPEALISLAQLGVLEVHPWGSKNNNLEHPDRLILDLDPDESLSWSTLTTAATEVRKRLKKSGLESFLKLTGGKGLHIVAPIEPTLTWTELKTAAHTFVRSMERDNPELYLTRMSKSARAGKIYLDYLRNERGATAVAPYSPRARLGAHVSLPLPWSALKETSRPVFSVQDLDTWRSRLRTDPWKALLSTTQRLLPEKFDAL